MKHTVPDLIDRYRPDLPLEEASTCPAAWYVDPRILELEQQTTFARSWQYACRLDQVREPGEFVTFELAGEPLAVVRGSDGVLRGFFNVCRHHAAAVLTEPSGCVKRLRCPYHGWTYTLEGALKAAPAFEDVRNFDPAANSLVPVATAVWENWVFVRIASEGPTLRGVPRTRGDRRGRSARLVEPALVRPQALRLRLQLEGVRRQLPRRRLPRALPARGPRQRARLPQVHDRERPPPLPAVEPDGDARRRGRDRRGAQGRAGPVLLVLPELHVQLVRGRDGHEPRVPARRQPDRGDLRLLVRGRVRGGARNSTAPPSTSPTACRTRTRASAAPCSAACARAPTIRAACPFAARRGSSCSTACCTPT